MVRRALPSTCRLHGLEADWCNVEFPARPDGTALRQLLKPRDVSGRPEVRLHIDCVYTAQVLF
jgi:hypothetical protein